ncbi:protein lifeguard 3-like [Eublepharis macularius]|uniref:Protein lifeguard 3-like n=1 Tax=Eublepharis macularius TaxID=481883 RepID=A0AA97IZL6_EUBMA|nr:protein lifeguard 3-like [Eublepharis macularius]XP_054828596.1 protein lifeguard 3-like [Eublepharis macularius]
MSNPSAHPTYDNKEPLQPPPYSYREHPPNSGYYPHLGGYPEPVPPLETIPINFSGINGTEGNGAFSSADWDVKKVRHNFIRKVYSILSVQLLVTVGIVAVFTFVTPVSSFVRRNVAVYYVSYGVFLVTYLVLACCEGPRRRFPWNIILLSIFTLALSFMTGTIASMYDTKAVILAMIITAIVAIIVTIFCFQTKVDFTSCTGLFCVLTIVFIVTAIITAIVLSFKYVYWLHMLYAAIGAIVFTLFLAYDTQLVLGNKKFALSAEDYISGALEIYIDVVRLFTFLLQIVGGRK